MPKSIKEIRTGISGGSSVAGAALRVANSAAVDAAEMNEYLGERPSVTHIEGTVRNFTVYGLPSEHDETDRIAYYFYPSWLSQLSNLFMYFVACIVSIVGSNWGVFQKYTVIPGKLFPIGNTDLFLHLPLLTLIPGFVLGKVLFGIYNSRFIIDETGVEAQVGLVSMYLRQPRLRFEDIRGVEPEQSLVERILGIGRVLIGSAMMADVEIVMEGIANPRAIQILINKERDRRLKVIQHSGAEKAQLLASD